MAHWQASVPWVKGGFYIIVSRILGPPPPAHRDYDDAHPSELNFSFLECTSEDGSEGRWFTHDNNSSIGLKRPKCWRNFPSQKLPGLPWPDHAGRVPHAVALVATTPPWTAQNIDMFDLALDKAWYKGCKDFDWFERALVIMHKLEILVCPDAAALLHVVRYAAEQPMVGQAPINLDVARWCKRGPGGVEFSKDWAFDFEKPLLRKKSKCEIQ